MRQPSAIAAATLALLTTQLPAQDAGPTPQDWARMKAELEALKAQMGRKDSEVSELRAELERLRETQAKSGATALERLELEAKALGASLLADDEALQKKAPTYPAISLGGQLRWRFESRIDFDFDNGASGTTVGSNTSYGKDIYLIEQRARIHAGVDLSDDIHGFVQVQDARRWGEENGPLDDDAEGLDMHQAYLRIEDFLGSGGELRLGRQEVKVANQRLISSLDWATQARSYDGLVYDLPVDGSTGHFVALKLRDQTDDFTNPNPPPSILNGRRTSELLVAGWEFTPFDKDTASKSQLYPYVIFWNDDTEGGNIELWTGSLLFESQFTNGFYVEAEGSMQYGRYSNRTGGAVRRNQRVGFGDTYAYVLRAGFKDLEHEWQPSFILEWNHATGDNDNNTDKETTRFNPIFPFAHYYNGYMDYVVWRNTRNIGVRLGATPVEGLKLGLDTWFFWTDKNGDTSGAPNLSYPGAPAGKVSRHLGTEVDLTAKFKVHEIIDVLAGYSIFIPGGRIDDFYTDDDLAHFFYLMCGVKF